MQRWRSAQNPMYECSFYLALPHVCRPESRRKIQNLLNSENRQKYTGFLVRNLEELVLLRETEYSYEIIADGSLYQWNRGSQALLLRDCDRLVLPWELSEKDLEPLVKWPEELAGIGSRELLTVYGRLPMMVTAGCVRRTEGICSGGPRKRSGQCTFASVMDRKGVCFPVRCVCEDCYNVIYNSLPQSLHQFVNPASVQERSGRSGNKSAGIFSHIGGILCSFTTESGEETARVLRYFGGEDQAGPPVTEYTNGHFRRSAL